MATMKRNAVVGVFENARDAQRAVAELRTAGFSDDMVGVASHDRKTDTMTSAEGTDTHADTGAVTGALAGVGVGAAWGLGIAAGLLPGIGPVIAGGTLAAILASAGLGAAVAGLAGALIGLGIPEEEAQHYESEFQSGRTIVTVKSADRYDEAAAILRRNHGHVQERTGAFSKPSFAQARTSTAAAVAPATGHTHAAAATHTGAGATIQRTEEELHAHKHAVQAGEVRVRKEVITEHKTLEVPVTREEVVIERRPAGPGAVSSGDIKPGEEVRIAVKEEHVHVEKTPVVKEEISIGKRQVTETEQVSGTVRKEQVKIEKAGEVDVRADDNRK